MISLADYKLNETPLCDSLLRISQQIRADFPLQQTQGQLAALVAEARRAIPLELEQDLQVDRLLTLFYQTWGFGEAEGIYQQSDTLWLDRVLQTRKGTPLSLGAIFLHIVHALELPLMAVCFPTQLILRGDWLDGDMWLINPLNGETLTEHMLEVWLKGHIGSQEQLLDEDLEESNNDLLVRKFLLVLKSVLMEEEQFELALTTCEMLLYFDPDNPYEIRDRGLIYAQLDCNHIALSDLSYFISHCPEDPVTELIKNQINSIQQQQLTLH